MKKIITIGNTSKKPIPINKIVMHTHTPNGTPKRYTLTQYSLEKAKCLKNLLKIVTKNLTAN